ncbi:Uncharacterised protein [Mycobacterium tuberculosis]|uniref:Uncharacterized protein n=1 Tax=Mycobacterium tuberculosis TaxID=1773 RepID=A0A654TXJ5_MYCTX|nr:Uncharacterised protein [Mycobacterium tuberculosis]CMS46849.1 Uncharacterised protein [Mycobacterium tuberculosis]CMT04185.1 Uncharacterised protein [Mycobacterium tuberculosis]
MTPDRGDAVMAHERDEVGVGNQIASRLDRVGYSPIDGPESVGLADLPHVRS